MNPVLHVTSAGRGQTPPCPDAKYKVGDRVRIADRWYISTLPRVMTVLAVVPPGFPASWALADAEKRDRPLMHTKPSRAITYVLGGRNGADVLPQRLILGLADERS